MNNHPITLLFPEKTFDDARRAHVLQYGKALVLNTWLLGAVVLLSVLLVASLAFAWQLVQTIAHQPLRIVKVDELGRTSAINFDTTATLPPVERERVMRSALSQFVRLHFSRVRGTIQQDYPASLFFMAPGLVDASINTNSQTRVIETFLADGTADDVDAAVQNVTFQELQATPFRAGIDFEKVFTSPATHRESRRERYVAQVAFVLLPDVPNNFVKVNPLGVQVVQLRIDQAFQ
jgi:type IV secretory pathway TrbF-like protein